MSKKIELRVLLDYNSLDTVIERLTELREEHGGTAWVEIETIETDSDPYCDNSYVTAHLIVPD